MNKIEAILNDYYGYNIDADELEGQQDDEEPFSELGDEDYLDVIDRLENNRNIII